MLSAQLREVIARSPESTSSNENSSERPVSPTQRPSCADDLPGDVIPASPPSDLWDTACVPDPPPSTSSRVNVNADLRNVASVPHLQPPSSPVNVGASTSCANVVPNNVNPPLCPDPPLVDPDRPVFPNEAIQVILQTFRDEWLGIFQADSSWDEFSSCLLITSSSSNRRPAPRRPDRPTARPARPAPDARFRQRFDAVEASRFQGLYRYSRKRAARHVLRLESASYTGPREDAQNYFQDVFSQQPFDTEHLSTFLNDLVPTVDVDESLCADPTPEEISFKLRGMANSAPGKDRVEYRHLRMLDPKCEILALIYSRCVDTMCVPDIWKTATTILIHKRGVTDDVSIVKLWNTISKFLTPASFTNLLCFKRSVKVVYKNFLETTYDIDTPCTWTLVSDCPCHKTLAPI